MDIVLIVVDSLRAKSLITMDPTNRPATPFLDRLATRTLCFVRAYATECWTLPTHASMFTGLLPSEHNAHFQTMAYRGTAPTIAEILSQAGRHTEVVTRNFVFDGTIPGITRGFQKHRLPLSTASPWNPFALFLTLAKPRFRRHVRQTGFFHPRHRESRQFLARFARAMYPADTLALEQVVESALALRKARKPYFIFCNLYDVHAPYPPTPNSILRSFRSIAGIKENLMFPAVMARLGAHQYLRDGFRISPTGRSLLTARYHRAIEMMDAKLAWFYSQIQDAGLLENTIVIITSDHGEAFGEHGLYLHDASVYNTHLHVPLWIHHPERPAEVIEDVVSTRHLFGVMKAVGLGLPLDKTILSPSYRAQHPVAMAEHFFYPHLSDAHPRFRQHLAGAVARNFKVIVRGQALELYRLSSDPEERHPIGRSLTALVSNSEVDKSDRDHLLRWCESLFPTSATDGASLTQ